MSEANTLNGLPSCKQDELGGAREVFRDNRCAVRLIDGFAIAICPGCNWLASEAEQQRFDAVMATLRANGYHVRMRRPR